MSNKELFKILDKTKQKIKDNKKDFYLIAPIKSSIWKIIQNWENE